MKQLLAQPQRQRHAERREPAGAVGQIGLKQTLEFDERFVVENDVVDFADAAFGFVEAIVYGAAREIGVELLAGEPLFLRRGGNPPIFNEGRGTVVIEGGQPENTHRVPQNSV